MTWVKIDESMTEHPKVAQVSDRAFRLHVSALCYANRVLTDGHVPDRVATQLVPNGKRAANELVDAGIWERHNGGFEIHDYLEYQPSKAEVEDLSRKRAEAGRAGGKKKANREASAKASAKASAVAKPVAKSKPGSVPDTAIEPSGSIERSSQGQPLVVAPEIDHQIRNGSGLTEATQSAILELVAVLTDATDGTIGRLVKLGKRGAGPAAFHDARQGIATTSPRHPSRVACRIVEEHLEAAR
jgi:hypothetical protein